MKKWNYAFEVPEQKKVRIIVHTDCKNEADDQFALAHHLMTPKFIVKGIVGGHFNLNPQEWGEGHTADASVAEAEKILELMEIRDCPVYKGSEHPIVNEQTPQDSQGAQFIIDEAMREDEHPLYIAIQGSITDLASAILMKPEICQHMTAIWIGGGAYPEGGFEFNMMQDLAAVNVVLKSQIPLWQIPINVYKQVSISLAEVQQKVMPHGKIGKYLFEEMAEFNIKCAKVPNWPHGEVWGLGDSATIGVLMEEIEKTDIYDVIDAPIVNTQNQKYEYGSISRKIRVYKKLNTRLILSDFFAKLAINYPEELGT